MADPLLSLGMAGESDAASWLESFDAAARLVRWGSSWGERMAEEMRREAPYRESEDEGSDKDSEHLRDSIAFAGARPSAGGVEMTWTSDVAWAQFVIEGTGAHEIHATVAKALHWKSPEGEHFAVSVMHPGTKANPFPLRAVERLAPEMAESLAMLFEEE